MSFHTNFQVEAFHQTALARMANPKNPIVFMDVSINGSTPGRMVFVVLHSLFYKHLSLMVNRI